MSLSVYTVYGNLPGSGLVTSTLVVGYPVQVNGSGLDTATKVVLPGLTVLAADFTGQTSSRLSFVLPDVPGVLGGRMRVYYGLFFDEATVDVLRPEAAWRHPEPVLVTGISSMVNTTTSPMAGGRYKTVGSNRVGDGGAPSYNDDTYPPAKMGYDSGTIGEQITAVGIDGGYFYTGMTYDGYGVIPRTANMPGTYPSDPPGSPDHWLFEYQGQPSDQVFAAQSPVLLKDAFTTPLRMHVALTPTYTDPRLTDTGWRVYALPVSEVTDTEAAGFPDTHLTKPRAWFTGDKLLAAGDGPNFHGDWNDGFSDGNVSDWIAVSTALSPSAGFTDGGLKATGAGEFRSPPTGATPGFHYRMDCWIGNAPAAGGTVTVGIAWLDRSGAQLSIDWGSSYSVDSGGVFTNRTYVSGYAPTDPAVWSRQLVFQFSGCASLEVDSVNFRYDPDSPTYFLIVDLEIPTNRIYVNADGQQFVVLVGATDPGIEGTAEAGALSYAMEGATDTAEYGSFQPRVSYQPTPWRYWLPVGVGTLEEDAPVGGSGWSIGAPAWRSGAARTPGAPRALQGSGTEGAPFMLADQRWWTWDNPVDGGPFDYFHIVEREAFYSGSGDVWDPASYTEDEGRAIIDFITSGISAGTPDGLPYAIPGHEAVGGDNLLTTADSGLGVYSDRILTVTSVGPGGNSSSQKAVSRALP